MAVIDPCREIDNKAAAAAEGGRFVVFNADDFGYTRGINEGVWRAHAGGLLSSASLMASGSAFEEAIELAARMDGLELGVHLCATQTSCCLAGHEIPDLVTGAGGFFRYSVGELGARLLWSAALAEQILREWRAQIERILGEGIHPAHLNSHQHIHMHPSLFGKCLELAEEYGIPVVRMPYANFRLNASLDASGVAGKIFKAAVFGGLRWSCLAVHRAEEYGVLLADHTYGLLQIGRTDENYLCKLIPRLPAGLSEIYIHPGVRPEPCSPWIRRDLELDALLSPRVRGAVEEEGLVITTFRRWAESLADRRQAEPARARPMALTTHG